MSNIEEQGVDGGRGNKPLHLHLGQGRGWLWRHEREQNPNSLAFEVRPVRPHEGVGARETSVSSRDGEKRTVHVTFS